MRRPAGGAVADALIYAVLILLALVIILPFYNMLLISFSKYEDINKEAFYLFPKRVTLENYQRLFEDARMFYAFGVSVFNVAAGTAMSMAITVLASYSLSRRNVPFRRLMFYICIFTMYFGAGLLPWYMVLKSLGFVDSIWVMTVPGMLSTFNMILMRNFFLSIPESMEESARLDGAGEFRIMWQIMVPLSLPIMATVALFYAVGFWNEWWNAMIFLQNPRLYPMTLLLRKVVIETSVNLVDSQTSALLSANRKVHSRAINMACAMVVTLPILCVYPFLQKFFTKGIMLGAIKA